MPEKILYCASCHIKVAIISEGSKLKSGMVALCSVCETKRKASDLANKTKKPEYDFNDMLGEMFGERK